MSDSEKNNLTKVERELVKDVLTRAWLSVNLMREDGCFEDNGCFSLVLSMEQKDSLATAINKI